MSFHQSQLQPYALSGGGAVAGATSITLKSFKTIDGVDLSMTDFGDVGYGTLEPGNGTSEEQMSFTGITQNSNGTATLSGVKSVLFLSPYTETSGLSKTHAGSTPFVISNTSGFYNQFAIKDNDETIDGQWTFTNTPIVPGTVSDASTTVKGVAKISVAPADPANPISVGINDTTIFAPVVVGAPGLIFPFAGSSTPTGFLACDGSAVSRATYAALFTAISTTWGAGDGSTTFNLPDLRGRSIIGAGTGTKVATFASRSSNVITVTGLTDAANNEFQTGQLVAYSAPSGAMTGLTSGNNYYLIRTGNLTFSLASSLANAQNGTAIALSSDGTGTQTFTLTLTARSLGQTGGEETHAISATETLAHVHNVNTPGGGGSGSNGAAGLNQQTPGGFNSGSFGGNAAMNNMDPFGVITWIIKT